MGQDCWRTVIDFSAPWMLAGHCPEFIRNRYKHEYEQRLLEAHARGRKPL